MERQKGRGRPTVVVQEIEPRASARRRREADITQELGKALLPQRACVVGAAPAGQVQADQGRHAVGDLVGTGADIHAGAVLLENIARPAADLIAHGVADAAQVLVEPSGQLDVRASSFFLSPDGQAPLRRPRLDGPLEITAVDGLAEDEQSPA